jgi:hypothetical protein
MAPARQATELGPSGDAFMQDELTMQTELAVEPLSDDGRHPQTKTAHDLAPSRQC